MNHILFAGAVAPLFFSTSVMAQSAAETAAWFGARQSFEDVSISPAGNKVAYVAPLKGQGSAVYVVPLDGSSEPRPILTASGDPDRLGGCRWAAETRLVCTAYGITTLGTGEIAYFTRQIALDEDGGNMKVLEDRGGSGEQLGYNLYGGGVIDWLPGEEHKVLMTRQFVPELQVGTMLGNNREGLGVVRVDTRTLDSSLVESPKKTAAGYITDGQGRVRIMELSKVATSGYQTGETRFQYRAKNSDDWKPLSAVDIDGNGFWPLGVDSDLDLAYGLKKKDGRYAAYSVKLDGSGEEKLLFAHPHVDVDGFIRIGRRGRIVGASYVTEKREAAYFDIELQQLAAALGKALPGLPLIRFEDSSEDETRLVIWVGSDTDPGRFYLFDRKTKQLGEIGPVRPALAKTALAPMTAVNYPAADGTQIPAYLTLPPGRTDAKGLAGIVLPHGGPWARDEWGFDWLAQYFASRGYAVLQPNFRGSAGYGDAWFEKNGFRSWRTAIGDVADGGRWLKTQGVDPEKLAVFGWSYGGYAALQSAAVEPNLFKAAVAVAPVTDLAMLKEERRYWSDYRVVQQLVGEGPHVVEGSPARNASKIKVPVLMFHGTYDRNVGVDHSRRMASELKEAGTKNELVVYDKLDHHLVDSAARADMLERTDAFLRASLGL